MRYLFPHALLFLCAIASVDPVAAQALPPLHDLPSLEKRVVEVFTARCGACHSEAAKKIRGKFGYVTDLARVAEDYLDLEAPVESELWERLVETKRPMPPKNSADGPLTLDELSLVRWWIETRAKGADVTPPDAGSGETPEPVDGEPASSVNGPEGIGTPVEAVEGTGDPKTEVETATSSPKTPKKDASESVSELGFLEPLKPAGAVHLVAVHFPIALLMVAAFLEALGFLISRRGPVAGTRLLLWLGALAAMVAAVLGWVYAEEVGRAGDEVLELHRKTGVATAIAAFVVCLLFEWVRRRQGGPALILARLLLLGTAVLCAVAGHNGGLLVHGSDPFAFLF